MLIAKQYQKLLGLFVQKITEAVLDAYLKEPILKLRNIVLSSCLVGSAYEIIDY
jgi:hypothetical protein